MSYALDSAESVPTGLRRIADEQAEKALDQVRAAAEDRDRADGAIHDARKRFKKVRAVLRLVRKELGGDTYHRENETWRDAGRLLADVRESAVLPTTVEALVEHHRDVLEVKPFELFVARLESRHEEILDDARHDAGALEQATRMVEEGRARIPAWPIPDTGFDAIEESLRKVYRRGRSRMDDAYDDPSGPRFHEWRKRTKYLWYQVRILAPAWPGILEPWADAQHDLADLLGEGNDLTDLLTLVQEEPELLPEEGMVGVLDGLARVRREALWEAARPLGRRLYAEEPEAFVARLGAYRDGTRPTDPDEVLLGT